MSERQASSPQRVVRLALVLILAASSARAQSPVAPVVPGTTGTPTAQTAPPGAPFELEWRAPAGCPNADHVRAEISRLIGPDAHPQGVTRVSGEITAQEGGAFSVRLALEQSGRTGERTLSAASCAEVSRAAALLVALAIEPGAAEEDPVPLPPPAPPPVPPAQPPPTPRPPPRVLAPPREVAKQRPQLVISLGPATEVGLLPALGAGAEATLGVELDRLSLEAYGADYLHRDQDAELGRAGGTFALLSLGARACFGLLPGRVSIAGCAAFSENRVRARGYGVSQPGSATTHIGAASLGVRVQLALGSHASLRLDAGPGLLLGDANFVLAGIGAVYRVTRFDAGGSLKLAWHF